MKEQDEVMKFLAYGGKVSIVCAKTSRLVEEARKIHDLSPVVAAALGRTLTMAVIMGAGLKNKEDSITIQLNGTGPIGTIASVVNAKLEVKGYVSNPRVDLPIREDHKLDVGQAVGKDGNLYVIKDMGLKEPYIGLSKVTSGEIAEDFAQYYALSEQKNTAVALGVLVQKEGVKEAGGYIVTPMPDATEDMIFVLENRLQEIDSISTMLEKGLSMIEIAKEITGDDNIQVVETGNVPTYHCDCSKERMANGLVSLGETELRNIIEEDGKAETVCHFCNQTYCFDKTELEELIKQTKEEKKTT